MPKYERIYYHDDPDQLKIEGDPDADIITGHHSRDGRAPGKVVAVSLRRVKRRQPFRKALRRFFGLSS